MVEVPPLPDEIRATLPPVVVAYISALEAAVQTLSAATVHLTARVAELEARLGQTSANSSRPPSSDPPRRSAAAKPPPGQQRPGGQPGHRGAFRVLLPQAHVTATVQHLPPACDRCGAALPQTAGVDDPPDQRHQVVEVLPIQVAVTEHHLAARTCGTCGHRTRVAWPAGVRRSVVGPRLAT